MSVYDNTIPSVSHAPSIDQPLMLSNFDALQDAQDKNHITLDDTVSRGKHKFMQMPVQAVLPATAANEGELHTQTVAGTSQLFYSRDNTAGTTVQLTSAIVPVLATLGYTFLPGNLLIQWGINSVIPGLNSINYGRIFTVQCFTVVLTPNTASNSEHTIYIMPGSIGNVNFSVNSTFTAAVDVSWIAIGRV